MCVNGRLYFQVTNRSLLKIGDIVYLGNYKVNNHSFDGLWMIQQFGDHQHQTDRNKTVCLTPKTGAYLHGNRPAPYDNFKKYCYITLPRALFGIVNNDVSKLDTSTIPDDYDKPGNDYKALTGEHPTHADRGLLPFNGTIYVSYTHLTLQTILLV